MKFHKNNTLLIGIFVIIILSLVIFYQLGLGKVSECKPIINRTGLLSPRVYAGLINQQNHLPYNMKPLEEAIISHVHKNNLNISVYIENLRDGSNIGVNEEDEFEPASLNKLPIAIIILRKVELGQLSLDDKITLTYSNVNNQSGSLYTHVGESRSVRELIHFMLSESDNTATRALSTKISLSEIEGLSTYLNYYDSLPFQEKPSGSKKGFLTTARSTYNLFASLYFSSVLTAQHSELILSELTNTSFDIKGYARLPDDVKISQKYGDYYGEGIELFHSCGILYKGESRFFYCVMTKDLSFNDARIEIGTIVNGLHDYIEQEGSLATGLD